MVSDINLIHSAGLLLVLSCEHVILNFFLMGSSHLGAERILRETMFKSLSHFNSFQTKSSIPLVEELVHFVFLEPRRGHQLFTPEGHMVFAGLLPNVFQVAIAHSLLVVVSDAECPHWVFVQSMVNDGVD